MPRVFRIRRAPRRRRCVDAGLCEPGVRRRHAQRGRGHGQALRHVPRGGQAVRLRRREEARPGLAGPGLSGWRQHDGLPEGRSRLRNPARRRPVPGAAWARSTRPATPASTGRWPSRSFPTTSPATPTTPSLRAGSARGRRAQSPEHPDGARRRRPGRHVVRRHGVARGRDLAGGALPPRAHASDKCSLSRSRRRTALPPRTARASCTAT